jgi:ribosomal protein S18 acetylase RimI-like enzyme
MFNIRKVTPSQINELVQISSETFIETFSEVNSKENMQMYLDEYICKEKLSSELNHPNSEFYFATINDRILGYLKINTGNAQIEFKDKHTLEIERLYVLKEFIGKQFGQSLFNFALHKSKQMNAEFLWLGVWEKNFRAIRFYEKNGLTIFDKHDFKLGNDMQNDVLMKLHVTQLPNNQSKTD